MHVPSHNAPGFKSYATHSYSETRWGVEDSPSEINRGQCLPSCHVPKPTAGQISPSPPMCWKYTCTETVYVLNATRGGETCRERSTCGLIQSGTHGCSKVARCTSQRGARAHTVHTSEENAKFIVTRGDMYNSKPKWGPTPVSLLCWLA